MKKFIISTLCCFIIFNSFITIFSDCVFAKESFFEGVRKQYMIKKENTKKTLEKWKNSDIFKDKRIAIAIIGITTLGVIYMGGRVFNLFNRINNLKTDTPTAADNDVQGTVAEQSTNIFEEEEAVDYSN